jgi:transketolase
MALTNAKKAIFSYGTIASVALSLSQKLQKDNLRLDAYSLPALKPINEQAFIKVLNQYDTVYTLEEHNLIGGLSNIVADLIARHGLSTKLVPFAIRDKLCCDVGDQEYLRRVNNIDVESLYAIIAEDYRCA